ncbi:uncharacterized protein LOC119190531 [Manduca sexta]|uniref:uncharacterized protein LOC119190531 n=1 Tax=Manduca sexta TaxID=7130 RepID=UPI00188FDDD8|nr:uncharacterized protein LOC119190531 [Manduca sexta]
MQFLITFIYAIYLRLTLINVAIFGLKYVPTAIYMYSLVKNVYVTSRARLKKKQSDLEDMQLQIQIINTKLSVRDAEFMERAEMLRRGTERLRKVRLRVREVIASDESLRHVLENAEMWDSENEINSHSTPQEEREYIVELLKELHCDKVAISKRQTDKMDCGERAQSEPDTGDNSVYSSLSDVDIRQDCRVKIVKVTNVYKVAYLKHFIKQKRLRRANRQAVLKKKMESIKKLLEDWQKTLNMVINNKLAFLDAHPLDLASQDARGDYSKPRESDSDSDLRNSSNDLCFDDEYSLSWAQNPYRPYGYGFEDAPNTAVSREHSPKDFGDIKYSGLNLHPCDYGVKSSAVLSSIIEEIHDQRADEIKSEAGEESDCRDFVAI